ncbi:MAG TPA: NAD(P)/FAD-dependent oxidoreductase [Bryobacteraceae bacterium]
MADLHKVVIIGGGFGGLYAAKAFRKQPVALTVIDRHNYHLFQPLLYQVATGALSPGEIASPIRHVLYKQRNTRVLLGEVIDIDAAAKEVVLRGGDREPYDTLVVATGAAHHYFGHPEWVQYAPGLKTIEDATEMRGKILLAFERAELEHDHELRRAWLTFVVVGGGATGVELAGALGEIANDTLKHDFRSIDPREARIYLIEGENRVLPPFPPDLSAHAERSLVQLNVQVRTSARVTALDANGVTVTKDGKNEVIPAKTILWAAGVHASPLGQVLHDRAGATVDKSGHVVVNPDLSIPGHPEILVIGDLASFSHQTGKPLPGVAQVAMQMGGYSAKLVNARRDGRTLPPFHYFDKGNLAAIGRAAAVAQIGKLHLWGWVAWVIWLFIHIAYLIGFDNRLVVMMEWAYNYFTFNRGARLITGQPPQEQAP